MNRRTLLGAVPFVALSACTVTTNGGTTSVSIDIATINRDGQALLAALQAALLAPSMVVLLGANAAAANAALVGAQAALAGLNNLTGGTLTASIDTSKAQAFVQTLVTDAQTAIRLAQAALGSLPGSAAATTVGNYLAAAAALLPFVALAASLPVPAMAPITGRPMSEKEALAVALAAR